MTSNDIRKKFLDFFQVKGHKVLPSASLVPKDDSSVLFTTAGMQQFRKFYANPEEAPAPSVATVQKCLRTSDIEEVGDESHLTFFEMLGNFSFGCTQDKSFGYSEKEGSYFKKEAIKFAWEFLTEVLKIEKNHIQATYFKDDGSGIPEDKESLEILQNIEGLKDIKPQGFDENFWSLGAENSPAVQR
jgi:alanyl-tRNA synthetase